MPDLHSDVICKKVSVRVRVRVLRGRVAAFSLDLKKSKTERSSRKLPRCRDAPVNQFFTLGHTINNPTQHLFGWVPPQSNTSYIKIAVDHNI